MEGGSEGKEGKREGGKDREREGDTLHTNPSLLPAPLLIVAFYYTELVHTVHKIKSEHGGRGARGPCYLPSRVS